MLEDSYILFSFKNSEAPISALSKLEGFDKARLIPLPPEIDAGCGNALRIKSSDLNKALDILKRDEYDKIFTLKRDENNKRIIEEYVF